MIPNDKKIKSLIKKIQKKCEKSTSSKKEIIVPTVEQNSSDELFNEMKKLPFEE